MSKNSSNDLWTTTPFIVASTAGLGSGCYTSIQSAINDAINAPNGRASIYIKPGTYVENLDFSAVGGSLFFEGGSGDSEYATDGVIISGIHNVPTGNADLIIQNISFDSGGNAFTSTSTSGGTLSISGCRFNSVSTSVNIPNWTGFLKIQGCNFVSGTDSAINAPLAASGIVIDGITTGDPTDQLILGSPSGTITLNNSFIDGPFSVVASGGGQCTIYNVQSNGTLTVNAATGSIDSCYIVPGGTAPCIAVTGGFVDITNTYLWTSGANPVITFAGGGGASGSCITCQDSFLGTANLTRSRSSVFGGNVTLPGGSLLQLAEIDGSSADGAACGLATLSAGQVTVTNSLISSGNRILVTRTSLNSSTAVGSLLASPGSGTILIQSYTAAGAIATGDTSIVFWMSVIG